MWLFIQGLFGRWGSLIAYWGSILAVIAGVLLTVRNSGRQAEKLESLQKTNKAVRSANAIRSDVGGLDDSELDVRLQHLFRD